MQKLLLVLNKIKKEDSSVDILKESFESPLNSSSDPFFDCIYEVDVRGELTVLLP